MPARRNAVILGLASAFLCGMLAASAQASTVSAGPETFAYKAANGEANRVELDFASAVSLRDPGALILPDRFAPLCGPIGLGLHEVVCKAPYGPLLVPFYGCDARCEAVVTLGDRDDTEDPQSCAPARRGQAVWRRRGRRRRPPVGSTGSEAMTCGPGDDSVQASRAGGSRRGRLRARRRAARARAPPARKAVAADARAARGAAESLPPTRRERRPDHRSPGRSRKAVPGSASRDGMQGAVLSSADSFRIGFGPVAGPEVGARPLFLLSKGEFQ